MEKTVTEMVTGCLRKVIKKQSHTEHLANGNHVLLRKPVCNPFAHIYFGDWVPKILTFSPWKMPIIVKSTPYRTW